MKSPSQTQSSNTGIHPITLSNSILQSVISSDVESPVFPIAMMDTSPESEAVQRRKRVRSILDFAVELIDDGSDFDPIMKASTKRQRPLQ